MVTVGKGYDLDYAGVAVGEAYRGAGVLSRGHGGRGAAGHLVRPRRRTAGLAECQQVGREPYNLLPARTGASLDKANLRTPKGKGG